MQPIQGLSPLRPPQLIVGGSLPGAAGPTPAASDAPSFKEILLDSIERARATRQQADHAVENVASGGGTKPADARAAIDRADATMRTVSQVRDALLGAFNEIKDLRI